MAKYETVGAYIDALEGWQAEVARTVRSLLRDEVPESEEAIKWSQPVWSHHGPFAYLKAFKHHMNIGFWRGVSLDDPSGLLQGDGKKMAHIRLGPDQELDWDRVRDLVRQAAALNERGGDPTESG